MCTYYVPLCVYIQQHASYHTVCVCVCTYNNLCTSVCTYNNTLLTTQCTTTNLHLLCPRLLLVVYTFIIGCTLFRSAHIIYLSLSTRVSCMYNAAVKTWTRQFSGQEIVFLATMCYLLEAVLCGGV
eukprot:GHVS01097226.1.p2 GENE.GHVS01097226.1~~GHVS01097226.1.p2  ORF type:complete len:126 (-),score=18.07 GHVS01097226.1:588-965(-)